MKRTVPLAAALLLLAACEKEITVDLPETEPKLVVEGTIEADTIPVVLLSRTQSYFAPTSVASIAGAFVSDAVVTIDDGSSVVELDRICSDQLTPELLGIAASISGISVELLTQARICIWTKLGYRGVIGRTYRLRVEALGTTATAVTTIPHPVSLDSTWFRLAGQRPDDDSLGFIWARLSDPDTAGNAYRWFARRINLGNDGRPKDSRFLAPLFSVFDDRYVNGLSFDFNYNRGQEPYSTAQDDTNAEAGYFKVGDTVLVRFASIGLKEYRFYNSYANNVSSQGDVFSNPSNARGNINGGLGIWCGLSTYKDTVFCIR
jgi:hypothetical protein